MVVALGSGAVAVLPEKTEIRLAVLHAGDWLLKLAAIGLIVGVWT